MQGKRENWWRLCQYSPSAGWRTVSRRQIGRRAKQVMVGCLVYQRVAYSESKCMGIDILPVSEGLAPPSSEKICKVHLGNSSPIGHILLMGSELSDRPCCCCCCCCSEGAGNCEPGTFAGYREVQRMQHVLLGPSSAKGPGTGRAPGCRGRRNVLRRSLLLPWWCRWRLLLL